MKVSVTQSCQTLGDPTDCSLPGSSVHGILQVRVLEWVTIPFSKGISLTQGSNPISYVSCIGRHIPYHLNCPESFSVEKFPSLSSLCIGRGHCIQAKGLICPDRSIRQAMHGGRRNFSLHCWVLLVGLRIN